MNWGNKKRNFCKSCKAFTQTLRFASAVESHCFKSCYHIFIHQLFCFMFHQMWSKTRNVLKGFPFYFSQLKFKWRAASKSSARVCSTLKNAWKICNANNFQAAFLVELCFPIEVHVPIVNFIFASTFPFASRTCEKQKRFKDFLLLAGN